MVSNCRMPAFLGVVLVNYASNMICIRLNNCTIFWKQWEFLHGLNNLEKLVSVQVIRRFLFSFFLQIKTLVDIERLNYYANELL